MLDSHDGAVASNSQDGTEANVSSTTWWTARMPIPSTMSFLFGLFSQSLIH
jgi:hypothetical protein